MVFKTIVLVWLIAMSLFVYTCFCRSSKLWDNQREIAKAVNNGTALEVTESK